MKIRDWLCVNLSQRFPIFGPAYEGVGKKKTMGKKLRRRQDSNLRPRREQIEQEEFQSVALTTQPQRPCIILNFCCISGDITFPKHRYDIHLPVTTPYVRTVRSTPHGERFLAVLQFLSTATFHYPPPFPYDPSLQRRSKILRLRTPHSFASQKSPQPFLKSSLRGQFSGLPSDIGEGQFGH